MEFKELFDDILIGVSCFYRKYNIATLLECRIDMPTHALSGERFLGTNFGLTLYIITPKFK
jgi:hypothetical protein